MDSSIACVDPAVVARPSVRSSPWLKTGLCFLIALVLVFGAFGVGRRFNVDENVFVASGALLSRELLLPYRDFHYNHMPTLVIVYAGLFRLTDRLLLAARIFQTICAAGLVAVVFHTTYAALKRQGPRTRPILTIAIVVALIADPMFTRTAGRAWNHDFPALMVVLGFLAMSRGLARQRAWLVALSGLLVGLAFTARLTFITTLAPFGLFMLLHPGHNLRRRLSAVAVFGGGCLIACLPSIWVWAQALPSAYFGNFQYPALNTRYHAAHGNADLISLPARVWYFVSRTGDLPGNGVVLLAFIGLMAATLRPNRVLRQPHQCRLMILLLLVVSQVAAGLTPAPPFMQYFYAATPFMILGIVAALAARPHLTRNAKLMQTLWVGLFISIGFAVPEYRGITALPHVQAWAPEKLHQEGVSITRLTGTGRVLTLEPILPLEGGARIYPALAAARFAMRVGDYLTAAQRAEYRMYGTGDIDQLFATHPPDAVLDSGSDDGDGYELNFAKRAQALGYRFVQLPHNYTVWIAPNGAKTLP